MEDLKNVYFSPLPDSPYVKPFRLNFTQNGKEKNWDLLEVHDSVAIVIFNVTRKVLVFVKQFRPAIYFNCIAPEDRFKPVDTDKYPAKLGLALEICAGIVDKNISIEEIAKEEVLEECGYDIPPQSLIKISSCRSGVGVEGALQTMFYCEVTDEMKSTQDGGGVDDEIIDVVEMTIPEVESYLQAPGPLASPPTCLYAIMWFLHHKADKYRKSYERTCAECKAEALAKREKLFD